MNCAQILGRCKLSVGATKGQKLEGCICSTKKMTARAHQPPPSPITITEKSEIAPTLVTRLHLFFGDIAPTLLFCIRMGVFQLPYVAKVCFQKYKTAHSPSIFMGQRSYEKSPFLDFKLDWQHLPGVCSHAPNTLSKLH